jgi:hypothetical protein
LHTDVLALEIRDAANAFFRKELETADVLTTHDRDRFASIDRNNDRWRVVCSEIDFAVCE